VKRRRIVTGVLMVLAVPGLGLGLGLRPARSAGAVTTKAAADEAAAVKALRYVVLDCQVKAQVKPRAYVLACADNGIGLQNMRWTSWTAKLASGYGTERENDCQPNCAEGHVHHYPVLAVLWGNASVQGHPAERRYTKVTLIYPGARPPVYVLVKGKVVATYPATQTLPAR
jgi:hypothetical protein